MTTDTDPSRYTRPAFDTAGLITIDMQGDFLDDFADDASCPVPGTTAILPALDRLVGAFRDAGRPIVHAVRIYQRDGSNVDLCRRAAVEAGASIVAPGSPGVELAAPLLDTSSMRLDTDQLLSGTLQELGPSEWAMYKPRWGAFFGTSLERHLRTLAVSTVVFAGCNFPNCPRTSIYEASERDFRIVLADDAISGLYERGRIEMANIGVTLMSTADLVQRLTSTRGGAPPHSRQ